MKAFNNIQELWDYCSYCPICQKDCCRTDVSVGPDACFNLTSFKKDDVFLDMQCVFKNYHNAYSVEYKVNCLDNTFDVSVDNVQPLLEVEEKPYRKIEEAYFYFYIQSYCDECDNVFIFSADIELDIVDKKVSDLQLERESLYLLKGEDKFHLTLIHDRNVMLVSRCFDSTDNMLAWGEDEKIMELPLIRFDLSDQKNVVQRLKTLILFS
jgi:hypothetical protein